MLAKCVMIGRRKSNLQLGATRLYVRKGKRVTTYYTITPSNNYVGLGHDEKTARLKLMQMYEETPPPESIAHHLDLLIEERERLVKSARLSPATLASNRGEVEVLKRAFGHMHPTSVRHSHIWKYLHDFRGKEAPVRANREIALLSKMFSRLLSAQIVSVNPCQGVERNLEVARNRLVSQQEFADFLSFLRKAEGLGTDSGMRVAIAAELAYLTSKAQGQILSLMRTQLDARGIRFSARKRGVGTLVEWTPSLETAVQLALSLPSRKTPQHVIFNAAGDGYTGSGFKSLWQRAMNAWCALGNERFTFHDIRAKAVTDLIEDGRKASEVTGHVDERVIAKTYDRRRERRAKAVR